MLERSDFTNPASVALFTRLITNKACGQESGYQLFSDFRTYNPPTQAEHIHGIVLDALVCRVCIVANGGIDALHLVGGDTGTHPGATH